MKRARRTLILLDAPPAAASKSIAALPKSPMNPCSLLVLCSPDQLTNPEPENKGTDAPRPSYDLPSTPPPRSPTCARRPLAPAGRRAGPRGAAWLLSARTGLGPCGLPGLRFDPTARAGVSAGPRGWKTGDGTDVGEQKHLYEGGVPLERLCRLAVQYRAVDGPSQLSSLARGMRGGRRETHALSCTRRARRPYATSTALSLPLLLTSRSVRTRVPFCVLAPSSSSSELEPESAPASRSSSSDTAGEGLWAMLLDFLLGLEWMGELDSVGAQRELVRGGRLTASQRCSGPRLAPRCRPPESPVPARRASLTPGWASTAVS